MPPPKELVDVTDEDRAALKEKQRARGKKTEQAHKTVPFF
jgi:hypothetical protein